MSDDFIAKNSEITEILTGVKLRLLDLPKFSGNVLEWSAFHNAFVSVVNKLSNIQKFTHLRSCLSIRALKCIEGYSVTNNDYPKAFQDLQNCFGTARRIAKQNEPDDNPSLSMVLLHIFETKLPRELKEKWELKLNKCEMKLNRTIRRSPSWRFFNFWGVIC